MDKSKLKKFALNSREKLLNIVENKIKYLLSDEYKQNLALYDKNKDKIAKIKEEYENNPDFVEEIAYMWFNRLIAIRFMELNNITECKILDGEIPEILTLAKSGELPENYQKYLSQEFYDLIEGKIAKRDIENEAYNMLFLAVCNYYNEIMPYMFESINDYTELLMPDNLLSLSSIRGDVIKAMDKAEDVEIIGWLYQFYITEKKDVSMKKNKYTKSDIPAVTQLFTPHWIVKYLVENSLGKLWVMNNKFSNLKEEMKYYIESDIEDVIEVKNVEEIKVLDPCCGSGHMLTYAFDLLAKIYEEEGYSKREIPKKILENNLFGCDIDKRAAILATFALHMKAVLYNKRFFKNPVLPNIVELQSYGEFENIKELGSLIKPENTNENEGIFGYENREYKLQKEILSSTYHCVIINPPYMGSKKMPEIMKKYLKTHYPDSKSDLFAVFIERGLEFTKEKGFLAMITMQSWMFLSSYEKLRIKLLKNHKIDTLVHLGTRAFEEIGGEVVQTVAFVIQKGKNV